jgi:hypothetical protein
MAVKKDKPKQILEFRKAARELGCDDSEERFRETLRTLAKQKPKHKEAKSHK